MNVKINGHPIDPDEAGTDLATAIAGRFSLDMPGTESLLHRVDTSAGWREVYDGPAPENFAERGGRLPRVLQFAAPNGSGWQNLAFLEQTDGSFSAVWSPDAGDVFDG